MSWFERHPWTSALFNTTTTLLIGLFTLVAADFGQPWWLFLPSLAWLGTAGLATTVAVLLTASVWGAVPGFSGLWCWLVSAALLSSCTQMMTVVFLSRVLGRAHRSTGTA